MRLSVFNSRRKVVKTILGVSLLDYFNFLPGQSSADLHAVAKGFTNSLVSIPVIASCARDYSKSLKNLTYPSEEYVEARRLCHERSASKVLKLAQHCGGIYLKAG